jgi:hypothetical protein
MELSLGSLTVLPIHAQEDLNKLNFKRQLKTLVGLRTFNACALLKDYGLPKTSLWKQEFCEAKKRL